MLENGLNHTISAESESQFEARRIRKWCSEVHSSELSFFGPYGTTLEESTIEFVSEKI